ncbi:MAG: diguanylate cyclase/phosphodiesterase & domain with sensor(s) [Acidimicrobiales bacterium]|nr:diguanylate cyclase/phosphodiesterase & domain with sensor(s) [Acidimicrobiales bacterium]
MEHHLARLGQPRARSELDPDEIDLRRDGLADERDRAADERDREADDRNRMADERDHEEETAERVMSKGVIDLQERRRLTLMRHGAAAERQQAALDRSAAAADRDQARTDRLVAAAERDDSFEEREILLKDELTGVLQRGAGLMELQRELDRSSRSGDPLVVAFLDVDGLKQINVEQGHGAGDDVLRAVGTMLTTRMRSYDLALRYGGDEFVCILPGFGLAEATARFRVLRRQLASGSPAVSVTFGLAESEAGEETENLIARADAALYDVRRRARTGGDGLDSISAAGDAGAAVAAHGLLNDSAVVSMGITTLQTHWNDLPAPDRMHLLERMLTHASSMDDGLKDLTQGRLTLSRSVPNGTGHAASGHNGKAARESG